MTTLQKIYDEIDANVDTIKRIIGEDLGYQISIALFYRLSTGGAGNLRRWIFIKDRGLPTEDAYWDGGKPEYLTQADQFPVQLKAQILTYQAAHPEFERYEVIYTFNADKYAIVKGYVYDLGAGKTSEKNFIFFKTGPTWFVREII